jgi:hypothetical protein
MQKKNKKGEKCVCVLIFFFLGKSSQSTNQTIEQSNNTSNVGVSLLRVCPHPSQALRTLSDAFAWRSKTLVVGTKEAGEWLTRAPHVAAPAGTACTHTRDKNKTKNKKQEQEQHVRALVSFVCLFLSFFHFFLGGVEFIHNAQEQDAVAMEIERTKTQKGRREDRECRPSLFLPRRRQQSEVSSHFR